MMMQANNIVDVKQHRDELKEFIQTRKNDLFMILDYATKYKKSDKRRVKLRNFRNDPVRLVTTIKDIHIHIRELQKEFKLLNKILKKTVKAKEKK
jgi:hypothetical protein